MSWSDHDRGIQAKKPSLYEIREDKGRYETIGIGSSQSGVAVGHIDVTYLEHRSEHGAEAGTAKPYPAGRKE